jgi:hypothetical protein
MYLRARDCEETTSYLLEYDSDAIENTFDIVQSIKINKDFTAELNLHEDSDFVYNLLDLIKRGCIDIGFNNMGTGGNELLEKSFFHVTDFLCMNAEASFKGTLVTIFVKLETI